MVMIKREISSKYLKAEHFALCHISHHFPKESMILIYSTSYLGKSSMIVWQVCSIYPLTTKSD